MVGGSLSMKEAATPVGVDTIEARIAAIPDYAARFQAALPGHRIDVDAIATAIASYERTFEPGSSAFDRWLAGDEYAISPAAKRGFALFNGKAGCAGCHTGWRLTDDDFHDIGTTRTDRGRGRQLPYDRSMQFAFKTPTLRSVALHPPYMHDGSLATLDDVVRHYEAGGIARESRSSLLAPIEISNQERGDLVEFLQTLTGNPEGDTAPVLPAR
jgi:cytochrome c peroxidase